MVLAIVSAYRRVNVVSNAGSSSFEGEERLTLHDLVIRRYFTCVYSTVGLACYGCIGTTENLQLDMADTNGAAQKRYLYVTVQEASGKSKDQEVLWEPSFTEGFVRGRIQQRPGPRRKAKFTVSSSKPHCSL